MARQKAVLWAAFLVIIALSLLAFISMQRLIAAGDRIERAQNALIDINRYLSDIKEVESSSRGYFVTGDDRFLKLRSSAIADSQAVEQRLRSIEPESDLGKALSQLMDIAGRRLAYSNRVISQRGSSAEAVRSIRLGSNLMDQLRARSQAIIDKQTSDYRAEQQALERQAWLISLALAAGVVLCLAIIAWLFALRGREVERRRQLEAELRALNVELELHVTERTAQLHQSQKKAALVIDSALDAVIGMDREGLITGWNPQAEKIFKYSREEAMGRRVDETIMPVRFREAHRAGLKRYLETGEARVLNRRFELMAMRSSGEEFPIELSITPIGDGDAISFSAFIRDVTDRKAREVQLRQLQRMDAIGRLTGGVAHDFNNLLAIIHGNSELLRDRMEDGSEPAEMTEEVIGAAGRGAELVRRLLAYARMQHLEPEAIDLNARLPNIIGLLHRVLGENITVRSEPAEGLWLANVDSTQVDDALVNLAINARDAMPDGGVLTIETSNIQLDEDYAAHHVEVNPGEYVMLAVSDTGTGMSQDVIDRAFEPFFTTKEEGQGTGLGLSQVFGWVKQSGGHIKIYSELGHGTTIKLYLPRAGKESASKQPAAEAGTPRGNETILVVEDNPSVRRTVIRQLHDLGYRTMEAESGARALELARGGTEFDLLLTDVIMPGGMTGYQLADELRADCPELKILFTSGYTELAASNGSSARIDPLLSKPYRKHDLGRAVRAALDAEAEHAARPS